MSTPDPITSPLMRDWNYAMALAWVAESLAPTNLFTPPHAVVADVAPLHHADGAGDRSHILRIEGYLDNSTRFRDAAERLLGNLIAGELIARGIPKGGDERVQISSGQWELLRGPQTRGGAEIWYSDQGLEYSMVVISRQALMDRYPILSTKLSMMIRGGLLRASQKARPTLVVPDEKKQAKTRRGAKPKPIWTEVENYVLHLCRENGSLGQDQPGWENQAAVEALVTQFIEERGSPSSESTVRAHTATAL
ncbi:MAG: hypothetical protein KIS86_02590 [Devosia sp.]|nr:hypothetical protein [Devosia sp.]